MIFVCVKYANYIEILLQHASKIKILSISTVAVQQQHPNMTRQSAFCQILTLQRCCYCWRYSQITCHVKIICCNMMMSTMTTSLDNITMPMNIMSPLCNAIQCNVNITILTILLVSLLLRHSLLRILLDYPTSTDMIYTRGLQCNTEMCSSWLTNTDHNVATWRWRTHTSAQQHRTWVIF